MDKYSYISFIFLFLHKKKKKRGGKNIRKKKLGRMERTLSKFFKFVFIDYLKDTGEIIIKMKRRINAQFASS